MNTSGHGAARYPANVVDRKILVAISELSLVATISKPAGIAVTLSPWLIQTPQLSGSPAKIGALASLRRMVAGPYSRLALGATLPPN